MNRKIKVAFIYNKSSKFLSGKHYDNTYYHFFMKALQRNEKIIASNFPTDDIFDASILKDKFDIILLWQNFEFEMPKKILGIQELDIPVISKSNDPKDVKKGLKKNKEWKIDYYFNIFPESYFHELYPSNFKYKNVIMGLEPALYQNVKPFCDRIKNKILNTGNVGNFRILSRIRDKICNPKFTNLYGYYLRTISNQLPYVDYTSTLQHEYVNDKYPLLLQKYQTSIAASSDAPTPKYWEIPAAGCLTFMEITDFNRGKEILEFEDGESAIFINKNNYKEKFEEYLSDPDNKKWEKIAKKGRKEVISKLAQKGVELEKFNALEMFGRNGTWHTSFFADKVKSIEIWEIDKKWEKKLEKNFPNSKIKILDSIKTIKEEENLKKFNLLLIDNPMNIFGQNQEGRKENYCEHFEILPEISKIIQDESLVIFNINRCPFDYDKYPLWEQRREKFYNNTNTNNMSLEFLHEFYTNLFQKMGFKTIFYINTVRIFYFENDMIYYFAYYLKKDKK